MLLRMQGGVTEQSRSRSSRPLAASCERCRRSPEEVGQGLGRLRREPDASAAMIGMGLRGMAYCKYRESMGTLLYTNSSIQ